MTRKKRLDPAAAPMYFTRVGLSTGLARNSFFCEPPLLTPPCDYFVVHSAMHNLPEQNKMFAACGADRRFSQSFHSL
jgi:hypothetical protein